MTEILPNALWICGIGELRLEIHRSKAHAIVNLTLPDDFRTWEPTHADLVEIYECYPFPDADLPDLNELDRLTRFVTELIAQEKRVIVHCAAGHNRSGLLTALIVREIHNMTGHAAMEFLMARRAYALWNKKYVAYLHSLDRPRIDDAALAAPD